MWKSPFNKIVRSKEALTLGVLVGLVIGGVIGSFLVPTVVLGEDYTHPISLCETVDNISYVRFSFHGTLKQVTCKDTRIFDNF